MLTEKTFDAGEVVINYAEGPENGPPLLLVHGFSNRWQSFMALIPMVAMRWHVFALDLRGHGLSGHVAGRYTLEDYARDVMLFMDKRLDGEAALYGHSLGGMVAIMIAARRPLRALVIGDSSLYRDTTLATAGTDTRSQRIQQLLRSERNVSKISAALRDIIPDPDPMFHRYHAKSCSLLDPDVFAPSPTKMDGYDCEALFPQIHCPVLILRADHITQGDADRALLQLADATLVSFDGVGHRLQNDPHGYAVSLAVAKFLESL